MVRRYRETRPLIEIRIREGRQSEIVEDVRNGAADFGIGYVNSLPELMESVPLRKEPLLVLIPLSHPLAAKKRPRVRLAELRDEPLVSAPSDTFLRRLTDGAAISAGFNLHYTVTVDRLLSILHHVCAGVGIGILPSGCLPDRAMGRRISRRPADRAVALGGRRAHHGARPLPHAGRVGDGVAHQRADDEAAQDGQRVVTGIIFSSAARTSSGVSPSFPAAATVSSRSTGYQLPRVASQRPAMLMRAVASLTSANRSCARRSNGWRQCAQRRRIVGIGRSQESSGRVRRRQPALHLAEAGRREVEHRVGGERVESRERGVASGNEARGVIGLGQRDRHTT